MLSIDKTVSIVYKEFVSLFLLVWSPLVCISPLGCSPLISVTWHLCHVFFSFSFSRRHYSMEGPIQAPSQLRFSLHFKLFTVAAAPTDSFLASGLLPMYILSVHCHWRTSFCSSSFQLCWCPRGMNLAHSLTSVSELILSAYSSLVELFFCYSNRLLCLIVLCVFCCVLWNKTFLLYRTAVSFAFNQTSAVGP